ncbi:hypothetical protein CAPTEDRAFT_196549 [Capitella teleta]|uniref:Uncharacterized protein n=1 Tax=Capitella teleta TaxID=283909 RepID=R7U670_CAPTE|nr:hypothetical protein CAPTEDRAFT_196549 [Capitella teleta]|eukprot:ELT98655.1 hypothetical protein CAPTEDRAFT_196549 [Capitella teleta]
MVEIRCNSSHDTWYLTCTGTEWAGEAGNCTNIENSRSQKGTNSDLKQEFPYKILIVVAIGVALGVFIGGLLLSLAAVYMKRKNRPRENPPEALGSMEVAYATQLRPSHMDYPMVFKDSHVVNDYPTFPQPSPNLSCPKHEIIYGRRCSQTPSFNSTSKSGRLYESPRHHAM